MIDLLIFRHFKVGGLHRNGLAMETMMKQFKDYRLQIPLQKKKKIKRKELPKQHLTESNGQKQRQQPRHLRQPKQEKRRLQDKQPKLLKLMPRNYQPNGKTFHKKPKIKLKTALRLKDQGLIRMSYLLPGLMAKL